MGEHKAEAADTRGIAPALPIDACGGCAGLGSHKRWCVAKVGRMASIYGPMAERLGSMGDTVGPNSHGLSNRLWALSADMRTWAESLVVPPEPPTQPAANQEAGA